MSNICGWRPVDMCGHTRYVFIHSNVLTYIYVDIIGWDSVPLTAATPVRIR